MNPSAALHRTALAALLAGCPPAAEPIGLGAGDSATSVDSGPGDGDGGGDGGDTTPPEDAPLETVPGVEAETADTVFDPYTVHPIELSVDDTAEASLRAQPTEWVTGRLRFGDQDLGEVGLRIKGSSSFQPIDQKPAWKIKLDHVQAGLRLHTLERLTLNNEVWDPTMMAETMSYWAFRALGSAAPRTGYAQVHLNGRLLGLYAIIESMDDGFMDHQWPGSNGGLWEMTRECDFTGDCTCFELQETGKAYAADGLDQGCAAVATGTTAALKEAFAWDALIAFLAVERGLNHPDSYSYNLNNFFVYHEPIEDKLFLSPWGADSTFIYAYPPSTPNPQCRPLYLDVDDAWPRGWLGAFCLQDAVCKADLDAALLNLAGWLETEDIVGAMAANRDMLDPYAAQEQYVNWTLADRSQRVGCFLEWTAQRPAELRAWVDP